MDDRKPSVKCACGHAFTIPPEQLFKEVACPKCGKPVLQAAAPATAPKSENLRASRSEAPAKGDGTKVDTKHDTTKGATPGTARKAPMFMKDGPLPEPIPGYTFQKRLGQGGMGEVLLAKQESLDRLVAIKLLPAELSKDKAYVAGFMREARSAGKVTHENIMGAIDVGESNGRHYFVMEYVQGETVFRLIKQQKTIPEPKALDIARQVARGLRHAHQMGLIHRDIKPQNVLITPEGQAKICDFGLATELKADGQMGDSEENVHTTPAYASPEQCRAETLDHRTDMYSLGVTLYEMLAGRRPFIAGTPKELMTKQVTEMPQPPRAINPAISEGANQLVLKLLRKQRNDRPKDYDELIAAFDAVLKSPSPKTVRKGPDAAAPARKPLVLIAGGAAAALVVIILLAVLLLRKGPAPATPAPAAGIDPEIQRRFDDLKAVQKMAMGRPGEYAAVRAKWKAAEEQYASTPHRALFAGGRVDFESAVHAEADVAAKEAVEEASKALAEGKTADALAALRRFPAELSGTPAGSKIAAKTLEIERAIDDRFREELQAIGALISSGKPDEARQKLLALRNTSALDGAEIRPPVRAQMDDLQKRIDSAIADAKARPLEPPKEIQPSVKTPADPKPAEPDKASPPPAAGGKRPDPTAAVLPAAAQPHYAVLRSPEERGQLDKRLVAAGFFAKGQGTSAFHRAAAVFLARDESTWKLEGAALAGLQEYLSSPELNHAETGKRSEGLTPERHQRLLELLVQKISESGAVPVEALQLFALAHLQEIAAHKGKLDPVLLLQARFAKGPLSDVWGPASSVVRVEIAGMLLKPPGLWVPRAVETASIAPDFPTRYLGALCILKDQTFEAQAAIDRWKKLGAGGPDPAAWTKFCDAVAERIKQETTCELCLGQGRYGCSACAATGAMPCATCRGNGKVLDPSEGTNLTCKACGGRRAVACTVCAGQKGSKCPLCEGKKTRPLIVGSHYRMVLDLGLCDVCNGTGSLFASVAFPCFACDGSGRTMEGVIKDFAKLPPWAMKGREGRMLHGALRWLARHQSPDGSWGASGWSQACPEPGCKAAPVGVMEVGVTALSLAAFLNAGFGPESTVELGNVQAGLVVRKSIAWLLAQQQGDGSISHGSSIKPVYENHLAAWSLFTATQLIQPSESFPDRDRVNLREAALRSLRWGLNNQAKGAGWGYTVGANSDTWVTSWGAMAMLAARDAGVDVPKINLGYVVQWMDSVTDKKDFHLGYMPAQMSKVNLSGNENYLHHDTLSALGSLVRLQLEGKPSATYAAADKLLERDLPNSDPLRRDYCYWYFGTVYTAFHEQRRGALWTQWTQALLREELQLQESADTCTLGSFPVTERWSPMGGKVYAASMNALTLGHLLGTRPAAPAKK